MLRAAPLLRPQSTRAVEIILHTECVVLIVLVCHVRNTLCDPYDTRRYRLALSRRIIAGGLENANGYTLPLEAKRPLKLMGPECRPAKWYDYTLLRYVQQVGKPTH
jgi:hypothetical protein